MTQPPNYEIEHSSIHSRYNVPNKSKICPAFNLLKGTKSLPADETLFHLPNYEKENHSRSEGSNYEKQKHNRDDIPNISGRWKLYDSYYLTQNTPDEEVSLRKIQHLDPLDFAIEQKGLFLTCIEGVPLELRPNEGKRLGIWKPTYLDGEIINWANLNAREQPCCSWEAIFSDYDDSNILFLAIVDVDKCGDPIKLHLTGVESGFQPGNPIQHPIVAYGTLTKMK